MHPKDIKAIPGSNVQFSIKTSKRAIITFNWLFRERSISCEEEDYVGSTTECLTISKCLPKHKGAYRCIVTDTSGKTFPSKTATLDICKPWYYIKAIL